MKEKIIINFECENGHKGNIILQDYILKYNYCTSHEFHNLINLSKFNYSEESKKN